MSSLLSIPRRTQIVLGIALVAVLVVVFMAVRAHQNQAAVLRAEPEAILDNPKLREVAIAGGRTVFKEHCASCHGDSGKGTPASGVPDLTDDDRLYGNGQVSQIEDIVRYGIRAHNTRGWNLAVMPAYASLIPDKAEPLPPQTPAQIEELTQFLLAFTDRATDQAAAIRGRTAYEKAGCWDCHGRDGGGDPAIGAPTLTDDIWLYGGSHDQIRTSLERGRSGISPAFVRTLDAAQIRNVAVYTASLAPKPVEPK